MKTSLTVGLAAAVLGGVLATGGCVPKEQYDEALAANRRARAELEKSLADQQLLRKKVEGLEDELAKRDLALDGKQREIDLLAQAKADLQKDFDALDARYKALLDQKPPPVGPIAILPPVLDKALQDFAKEYPDLIEYLPRYGMVKLKSDLTFDKGSDEVGEAAKRALEKFVAIIRTKEGLAFNIYIAGHTDDIPVLKPDTRRRHPNNWYLSVHRAVAVQDVVVKAGMEPNRIATMGFGEYHPVAPNAPGNKGNPANRRVEIWIVPPKLFLTIGSVEPASGE